MSDVHPRIPALNVLEADTLAKVAHEGPDRVCLGGCRMVGRQCPDGWCEAVYQKLRKAPPKKGGVWEYLTEPAFSRLTVFLIVTIGPIIAGFLRAFFQ